MKIINIKNGEEAAAVLNKIGVDSYGVGAMASKTMHINILLENQPCKVANILKQEMLSLGGDAAVARGSVACSIPSTDVLIMGTLKQVSALALKIKNQPFGLDIIARNIQNVMKNAGLDKFVWKTSRRKLTLGEKTMIMGILNVTPDSFSDGGVFYATEKAIEHGLRMAAEGADIIDVGGESTRPGSSSVPVNVELKRVIPVIQSLAKKIKIPLSIDTKKARVAKEAVEAGAEIVNDISALSGDKKMPETIARIGAAVVLMHMRGIPAHMQKGNLVYDNLMGEIADCLKKRIDKALKAGIREDSIAVDPGIGFGKSAVDNYTIIRKLDELKALGMPVMIGTSRKSFIGKVTGDEPGLRTEGTAATVAVAIMNGCHIVRVHDVAAMKKVASVADAILRHRQVEL